MSGIRPCSYCCDNLIFTLHFVSNISAPYVSFAKNSISAPPVAYYDYIIVGGGTAGCALAATLSEAANVLLLERGGLPYGDPRINNIAGFAYTLSDISPASPSQLIISTDGVITHRARVLGGGTALNAGFYSRASSEFVSKSGWDPKLVQESFEWVEKKVVHDPQLQQWQSAVRQGIFEAGVGPDNGCTYDHILGTKTGGSTFDSNGKRHTAADLLEYADPSKIAVHLHAIGISHRAFLNKDPRSELILAAGAIGSPQLLMLSGVGPAQQLMRKGIDVVLDQPMVGQGMADNPMNALIIPSPNPIEISLIQPVGITPFGSYIESASRSIDLTWALKLPCSLCRCGPCPCKEQNEGCLLHFQKIKLCITPNKSCSLCRCGPCPCKEQNEGCLLHFEKIKLCITPNKSEYKDSRKVYMYPVSTKNEQFILQFALTYIIPSRKIS